MSDLFSDLAKLKSESLREQYLLEKLLDNTSTTTSFNNQFDITVTDSAGNILIYKTISDYLSLGDIRVSLWPKTAQLVADHYGYTLPTDLMVDQIYKASTHKLTPRPYAPKKGEPSRSSLSAMFKHNEIIQKQLSSLSLGSLFLIAGHKKDIVLCNALSRESNKNNVAIYGWHDNKSKPIQPLNPVSHSDTYKDYSHGTRLIKNECILNGQSAIIQEIFKDPVYSKMVNRPGIPLTYTKYI